MPPTDLSLSECFLAALSNTYGSFGGLKILENKYFICFLPICFLFTVGSEHSPSFSRALSQFSCHVFQRGGFMLWVFFHFRLASCGCMTATAIFKHVFKCATYFFFNCCSCCGTGVGRCSSRIPGCQDVQGACGCFPCL